MPRKRCRPEWTIEQRIVHLSRRDPLSGCWLWQAATMPRGYGLVNWREKLWLAHRLSWIGRHGPIPKGGMICHRCDERRCVNPDHLFLGTRQVNMDDLKAKRLRRAKAADTGRMHIFIRGLELVGDVTWEDGHEQIDPTARAGAGGREPRNDAPPRGGRHMKDLSPRLGVSRTRPAAGRTAGAVAQRTVDRDVSARSRARPRQS